MLVKSFRDDLSWDVQRKLVNSYFRQRETVNQDQEELSNIPKSLLLEKYRDWFRTRKLKIRQVCDAYEVTKLCWIL